MFFVADINGTLHAYTAPLPSTSSSAVTGISSLDSASVSIAQLVQSATPLDSPVTVTEAEAALGSAYADESVSPSEEIQDAAVFEGHSPSADIPLLNEIGLTAGAAAAATAYRSAIPVNAEHETPPARPKTVGKIAPAQEGSTLSAYLLERGEVPAHRRVQPISEQDREKPAPHFVPTLLAEQIMTANVFTLTEDTTIAVAVDIFRTKQFRHIPVLSKHGRLIGLLSDRDLLPFAHYFETGDALDCNRPVRDFMTSDVLTSRPHADIRSVARVMFERRVSSMPIVDESGALVGLITTNDILRALVSYATL